MDLFTKEPSYLHIIHNDRLFRGDPFLLLSSKDFDELRLTYVSSPEFFFEKVKDFKKVIAILGEEETAREFYQFDPLMEERFIAPAESNAEILKALSEEMIELRYMKAGERIQSKVYILKSSSGSYRVMVGSANFTASAFGNKSQYEELIVYDSSYNPHFCDTYLKRFEEVYEASLDFLSEKTKKKLKNLILRTDNVLIYTPEDRADLTIEKVNRDTTAGGDASRIVIEITEEKERFKKKGMEIERIERIIEHVTKKTKDGYFFEPKERLLSLKEKLKEIVSFTHKRTQEFIDKRNFLHFNPGYSEFYIKEGDHALPYTISMEKDELRAYLERLTNFVNSYSEFGTHKDRETLKRVFETILFAFTSPLYI